MRRDEFSELTTEPSIVSVDEYRAILSDTMSTDDQILRRIEYLETFFREVIRTEIQSYGKPKIRPST